jgi:hypothetical protein
MGILTFDGLCIHTDFDRYVVATTTIWSGASYVYSKDAVKILSQPKENETDKP